MASFQKSQYIDILNIKKLYVKGDNNTDIPANHVLITDGNGGTNWINAAIINTGISFNTVITTSSTIVSGIGNTSFSILDGSNAGLLPSTNNTMIMYAKAFGQFNVQGQNSILSFNTYSGTITSNVNLSGSGIINISTDTTNNLINFNAPNDGLSSMSTAISNLSNLNISFSTSIQTFTSPFSTFIYREISSFSTSLGPVITRTNLPSAISSNIYTNTLNTSTINVVGIKQPLVQYGILNILNTGSNVVSITPYINSNYIVTTTYANRNDTPVEQLRVFNPTTSNFIVFGDQGTQFYWTTYGNMF